MASPLVYWFRILAFTEGISYLAFAVTMPLKYMYSYDMPNKVVGMLHGLLFVLYCLLVYFVQAELKWSKTKTGIALLASLLPFGPFWADKKLFPKA